MHAAGLANLQIKDQSFLLDRRRIHQPAMCSFYSSRINHSCSIAVVYTSRPCVPFTPPHKHHMLAGSAMWSILLLCRRSVSDRRTAGINGTDSPSVRVPPLLLSDQSLQQHVILLGTVLEEEKDGHFLLLYIAASIDQHSFGSVLNYFKQVR
jgi:hypothetical protein